MLTVFKTKQLQAGFKGREVFLWPSVGENEFANFLFDCKLWKVDPEK